MNNQYTMLNINTNSGPLAQIWLAANMTNVPKNSALQTSITDSAKEIAKAAGCQMNDNVENLNNNNLLKNNEFITLRTSGELLQGIVRVYSKQAGFLLSDIKDTLIKISSLFKTNSTVNVTISENNTITKINQLILEDVVTEKEVLSIPDLNFLEDNNNFSSGIINTIDELDRQVQGASKALATSAWDTSIELGRKQINNENFEHNNSVDDLDLDFDIDNSHIVSNEKSWLQGTKDFDLVNTEDKHMNKENENDDWNLAMDEVSLNGDDNNGSIELGRKADLVEVNETTEFNFDLDIEKEPVTNEHLIEHEQISMENNTDNKKIKVFNPLLKNTVNVRSDENNELPNSEMKDTRDIIYNGNLIKNNFKVKLTQKRLWEQMIQNDNFLPNLIAKDLVNYQNIKKARISEIEDLDIIENDMNDNIVDISLDDGELGLTMNEDEDTNNSDNFVDAFGDNISGEDQIPHYNDVEQDGVSLDTGKDTQSSSSTILNDDQIKLSSGETVSKSTLELATIIKEEVKNNQAKVITYEAILERQYANSNLENKDESTIKPSRKEACACFFDMLSLATSDCIDLKQDKPFHKITLRARDPIFEKFITV